jgi:glutaconate CoA-transferase, subunit A
MTDKVMDLKGAVATHVEDGDTIFVGGFGQCIPFATAHEIARQKLKNLSLCRSGADILFDMLIHAGCVKKVMVGYLGNPTLGLAHAFRRAAESGNIEVEDWSNFSIVLRLHAGALGVPFLPTATLNGGDMPKHLGIKTVADPYSGEVVSAVPALTPDVALIHAQRSDVHGNLQLFGLTGDILDGMNASRKIVATVEEIVSEDVIKSAPDRTIIPGFRVSSVTEVKWGAYPSYVHGLYGRDDAAYAAWDKVARKSDTLDEWLQTNIYGVSAFENYIAMIEPDRLAKLTEEAETHYG